MTTWNIELRIPEIQFLSAMPETGFNCEELSESAVPSTPELVSLLEMGTSRLATSSASLR